MASLITSAAMPTRQSAARMQPGPVAAKELQRSRQRSASVTRTAARLTPRSPTIGGTSVGPRPGTAASAKSQVRRGVSGSLGSRSGPPSRARSCSSKRVPPVGGGSVGTNTPSVESAAGQACRTPDAEQGSPGTRTPALETPLREQEETMAQEGGLPAAFSKREAQYVSDVAALLNWTDEAASSAKATPSLRPPLQGVMAKRKAKLDEVVRRRIRSTRFLSQQHSQLSGFMQARQDSCADQLENAIVRLQQHEKTASDSDAASSQRTQELARIQAQLADVEQRCLQNVREKQSDADSWQADVDECLQAAGNLDTLFEDEGCDLFSEVKSLSQMDREAEQFCKDAAEFDERRLEVEVRELSLRCMETSWKEVVRGWRYHGVRDKLDTLCAEASDKIAEDLIRCQPYMQRLQQLARAMAADKGDSAARIASITYASGSATTSVSAAHAATSGAHAPGETTNPPVALHGEHGDWEHGSGESIADLETDNPGDDPAEPVDEVEPVGDGSSSARAGDDSGALASSRAKIGSRHMSATPAPSSSQSSVRDVQVAPAPASLQSSTRGSVRCFGGSGRQTPMQQGPAFATKAAGKRANDWSPGVPPSQSTPLMSPSRSRIPLSPSCRPYVGGSTSPAPVVVPSSPNPIPMVVQSARSIGLERRTVGVGVDVSVGTGSSLQVAARNSQFPRAIVAQQGHAVPLSMIAPAPMLPCAAAPGRYVVFRSL